MAGMGFGPRENLYLSLRNTATGQIVLICAGALPGYCLTIFTVDSIGRKRLKSPASASSPSSFASSDSRGDV